MVNKMSHKTEKKSTILIGNSGTPKGYFCTICTTTHDGFVDIHITRNQAKELSEKLKLELELR